MRFLFRNIAPPKLVFFHLTVWNTILQVIDNQVRNADISGFNLFPLIVRPESTGTVRLITTDPRRPPLITPNHFTSINDVNTLIRGMHVIVTDPRRPPLIRPNHFTSINDVNILIRGMYVIVTDPRRQPLIRPNHFTSINDVNTLIRGMYAIVTDP